MSAFTHAPLSRHEALAPFSRDHYVGLVQAHHMIKASDADAVARRKAVAEFVDAWDHDIAQHFRDEENFLIELMSPEDRERMLQDHAGISMLTAQARELRRQADPDRTTIRRLGEALERHIRWEERELFNHLQQQLGSEQIDRLQRRTAAIEAARPRNACRKTARTGSGEQS